MKEFHENILYYRITSYNVCYTKLLRTVQVGERQAPLGAGRMGDAGGQAGYRPGGAAQQHEGGQRTADEP